MNVKKKRPTYFTIKDNDILWFIPLSSKVEKYQKIIDKKIERWNINNFKNLLKIKNRGYNVFFTDIDKIKKQMEDELK